MQVPADMRLVHHAADTFKGESGGPIYLTRAQTLHLVGIHTDEDTPQLNKGMRVTRRMLEDLASGSTLMPVRRSSRCRNDMLVYMTATTTNSRRRRTRRTRTTGNPSLEDGEWEDEVVREDTGRRIRSRLGPGGRQRGGARQA